MGYSQILVPLAGTAADDEAVRLACQVAQKGKTLVLAVHVIEVQRTLPLNSENSEHLERGEQILEHAEQVAKSLRGTLETEILQAREAGPALMDDAIERGVDLIIMGVPYRKPLTEFYLGKTIKYILKNAACQVWLCREVGPGKK